MPIFDEQITHLLTGKGFFREKLEFRNEDISSKIISCRSCFLDTFSDVRLFFLFWHACRSILAAFHMSFISIAKMFETIREPKWPPVACPYKKRERNGLRVNGMQS